MTKKKYYTHEMTHALAMMCNIRCADGDTCEVICKEMLLLVDATINGIIEIEVDE